MGMHAVSYRHVRFSHAFESVHITYAVAHLTFSSPQPH